MISFFAVLFGLVFGSFYNVIIYRIPNNISIAKGRSFCPKCKTQIPWYRNIPVLTYLLQKGKCSVCSFHIPVQYLVVEILTATLWYWAFNNYSFQEALLFVWVSGILTTIAFIDSKHYIIPISLIISIIVGEIGYLFIHTDKIAHAIYGAIFGTLYLGLVFGLTSVLFKKQTMGYGDLLLVFVAGIWLGPINSLIMIFTASIVALTTYIVSSIVNGIKKNKQIPFGLYLSLTAIIIKIINIKLF
jgi:leader peptidase (prepilin peptidase) / N-methyltransferase